MISIFKNIFGKKDSINIDFSQIAVDMHSHLIPAIDDGSKSIKDSMAMLEGFEDLGYQKIITTPHIMSDYYQNTPETILPAAQEINKILSGRLQFSAAAEYYTDSEFLQKLENEKLLCISEHKLLFEFSFLEEPINVNDIIFQIQLKGYKPILAHPERYPYFTKNNKGIKRLKDISERGVDLQVNLLSLIGHYGPEIKKTAEQLIDANLVSWISSDCHHLGHMKLIKEKVSKSAYLQKLIDSGNLKNTSLL
tara:strand:- start:412 stop:1164 length:753 start_codon:yes stop_codon:yes gene_type:complete